MNHTITTNPMIKQVRHMAQTPTSNHLQHPQPHTALPSIRNLLYNSNVQEYSTLKVPSPSNTHVSPQHYTLGHSPQEPQFQEYNHRQQCYQPVDDPNLMSNLIRKYNKLSSPLKSFTVETPSAFQSNHNDSKHFILPSLQTITKDIHSSNYFVQQNTLPLPHSPITPTSMKTNMNQINHTIISPPKRTPVLEANNESAPVMMICPSKKRIMKKRICSKKNKLVQVIRCYHCGEVHTPEWRRGPYGNRTLCNACGLYYRKLIKRFDIKNANLIMRFNKLNTPVDRRIPLNVNVPNDIIEKLNNDHTLDSNYYSIKEYI